VKRHAHREIIAMGRNRIGTIIAAVVVVLLLLWLFVGIGDDEAVVTTEDGEAVVVETED
jgi:hypothetical protein